MARYAIYKGSQSAHCCFEATVVDTTKPDIIGGEHYRDGKDGQFHYEAVCECFSEEDAELVCRALNALDTPQLPKRGNMSAQRDYWQECIAIAAEECDLTLTPEQLDCLASSAESRHDQLRHGLLLPAAQRAPERD